MENKKAVGTGMPEIVVIGAAIMDVLARPADEAVFRTGSSPMEDICMSTGGDALNEAVILARMGKKVRLETVLGDDHAGRMIREMCIEEGIAVEPRQIRPEMPTGINVVLIKEDGERSFLTNANGSLRRLKIEHVRMPFPEGAKILSFASIFVFPEIDCRGLKKIFAQAKSQGMTVCADMTKRKLGETVEDIKEALECVDYILPNEEEACLVTGKDTAEEAAERLLEAGVKNVVIKCGARGCLVRNRRECYRVLAKPGVRCIDTTGAGDSFAAGFIYALSKGRTLRECAEYANACGARAVQVLGATGWIQAGASDKPCENGG